MPVPAEHISFILRDQRVATSESPFVRERHGTLARTVDEPIETFFDNLADAQSIADQRQALLGTERRRWNARIVGLDEVLAMQVEGPEAPVCTVVDTIRNVDRECLVAEVGFDFAKQQASIVVWG